MVSFFGSRSAIWLLLNIVQLSVSIRLGFHSKGSDAELLPLGAIIIFGIITLVSVFYGDFIICLAIFAFQMLSTSVISATFAQSTEHAGKARKRMLNKKVNRVHYYKIIKVRKSCRPRQRGSYCGARPVDVMPSISEESEECKVVNVSLGRSIDSEIEALRFSFPWSGFAFDERKRRESTTGSFAFGSAFPWRLMKSSVVCS